MSLFGESGTKHVTAGGDQTCNYDTFALTTDPLLQPLLKVTDVYCNDTVQNCLHSHCQANE